MPSTKELRARIRSVTNTAKVTGAMQLIAASKMRRAQEQVSKGKEYSKTLNKLLSTLSSSVDSTEVNIPLLEKREVKNKLLIMITPERGLAGALIGNINRKVIGSINNSKEPYKVLSIGKKGSRFLASRGFEIIDQIVINDRPELSDTLNVSELVIDGFIKENWDQVDIAFSEYISTTSQKPTLRTILPITRDEESDVNSNVDYIYEPSPQEVLKEITPKYIRSQIFQSVLEAFASEHSARMVAMQNATDNANELIDVLTLDLNKARQETITAELLDLIGGISALEER